MVSMGGWCVCHSVPSSHHTVGGGTLLYVETSGDTHHENSALLPAI